MTRTRILAVLALALAAVALVMVGCTGSSTQTEAPTTTGTTGGTTVVEKNSAFEPSRLTVNVGDTVTFSNEDSVPHEVEIDGKALGVQQPGDSVTWKAEKQGRFRYVCTIHSNMVGEITAQP